MQLLVLAWRSISYYRARSALLLCALTIAMAVPLATRWSVHRLRVSALARAASTPMILGAKESRFNLVLQSLYFRGDPLPNLPYGQLDRVSASQLGKVIPLLLRFRARGHLIVGTTRDYFTFRELRIVAGEPLERLGDCLIGANVARELDIHVGERLMSDSDNLFDLTGSTALNMRVRGILKHTNSPDDDVVFCDLKTTWIMAGIGHGHALARREASDDSSHVHAAQPENQPKYSEVTDENLSSYHFHGRQADYPLSAALVLPESARAGTLLEGKYLSDNETCQLTRPMEVISEILQVVARLEHWFDMLLLILSASTALLVALILMLSLRLRQREAKSLMLLGCSRWTIARLMAVELLMIGAASLALACVLSAVIANSA